MAGEQSGYGIYRRSATELPKLALQSGTRTRGPGFGEVSVAYATGHDGCVDIAFPIGFGASYAGEKAATERFGVLGH
jgi:hypothetical protein